LSSIVSSSQNAIPENGDAIALRQIVAKNPIETGISVALTSLQDCVVERGSAR
jgi:hypothetical protein